MVPTTLEGGAQRHNGSPVWVYDGVCVLCSGAVRYTLAHERSPTIRFVALQSREGQGFAAAHGLDPHNPESFLFIENGRVLFKSDGVLALTRHLGGPARIILLARFVPGPIRDWLYDCIARNRYRLFGRRAHCTIPVSTERHRFSLPDVS
jgi:predicted DCC family thiol-disulfide oxidoreductase YuxK